MKQHMAFAENTVYLMPGRGAPLKEMGERIAALGFDVCGREILPPFSTLRFTEQMQLIQQDLQSWFWRGDAKLVGHSYGGYLLLHALVDLEAFPGDVLLFSPVLGAAMSHFYLSRPPRSDKLLKCAENHQFPAPASLEIHTGEADNGCDPKLAQRIGSCIPGATVKVLPSQGHTLSSVYVQQVLCNFLRRSRQNGCA